MDRYILLLKSLGWNEKFSHKYLGQVLNKLISSTKHRGENMMRKNVSNAIAWVAIILGLVAIILIILKVLGLI